MEKKKRAYNKSTAYEEQTYNTARERLEQKRAREAEKDIASVKSLDAQLATIIAKGII